MNERQFGTIYGLTPPTDQQLPDGYLIPRQQQFLAQGTFGISLGGQEFLQGEWAPPNTQDALAGAVWAAQRMFAEVQKRERRWNSAVLRMRDNMQSLTREVTELKGEIRRLQNLRVYVVPLAALPPAFQMTGPVPVTVEGDGETFTATFVEANVSASGETEADAIANFKDTLMSSYELLEALPSRELGPLPSRQWEILQSVVRRTPDGEHHEGTRDQNPR
jgi:hypothetical protein